MYFQRKAACSFLLTPIVPPTLTKQADFCHPEKTKATMCFYSSCLSILFPNTLHLMDTARNGHWLLSVNRISYRISSKRSGF